MALMSSFYIVFYCTLLPALTFGQTITFTPLELSSIPQAIGSDVIIKVNISMQRDPSDRVSLDWYLDSENIWNIFISSTSVITQDCRGSDCLRYPLKTDNSGFPNLLQHTLTIKNLTRSDNGDSVIILYQTLQSSASLNIQECTVEPQRNTTVIEQSEEVCGFNCTVNYQCINGYEDEDLNYNMSVCQANATFSPPFSSLQCEPVICPLDLSPDEVNAIGFDVNNVTYGDPQTFACAEGYIGSGATFECQSNKVSKKNISCSPVQCRLDVADLNNTVLNCSLEVVTFDKPVSCNCTNGYVGAGTISCLPSGDVEASAEKCEKVKCRLSLTSEEISFIDENVTTVDYGEPKNYSCAEGYIGDGALFKCYSNMTAEKNISCTPVTCPVNMMETIDTTKLKDCNVTSVRFGKPENCSCTDAYSGAGIQFNCSSNGIADASDIDCSEVRTNGLGAGIIAVIVIFGGGGGLVVILGGGYVGKKYLLNNKPDDVHQEDESPKTTSPLKIKTSDS